ncbi:MAG: hypothetical protein M3P18_10425, partial [Actinomycetota bacterium]|nr:hypothetical protein [Actinomycetota bacterium]
GGTDKDFGASPTLFSATSNTGVTPMVGACNKNGKFYALNQDLAGGPLWVDKIGAGLCFASAIFNPSDPSSGLYLASDATSINGTPTRGSLREVNPTTGSYIWQLPLPGRIVGSPSLNGSGVIAAAAYDTTSSGVPGVFLVDAGSGQLLTTLSTGGKSVWAQPVFADGYLLVGTIGAGLQAFAAP